MHSSTPSPSDKASTFKDSYFPSATTTSGRQRTAQACDKCRERKTKCSGEKPVCQRCTNRGLICEYSYREPRIRGPTRARIMSTASPSVGDSISKVFPISTHSRQDLGYPRPYVSRRNRQTAGYLLNMDDYAIRPVASGPQDLSSVYLGTEPRSYSEPRATHLPHWADAQHSHSGRSYSSSNLGIVNYGSSQSQIPAIPRTAGNMDYDTYSTLRQPIKEQNPSLGHIQGPSGCLLEAQEYGGTGLNYDYAGTATSECPLSSSSDSSGIEYHSNPALSSSTTTPPFYPLDTLEISSSGSHSRPMANNFGNDIRKRIYAEEDAAGLLHFSYDNKDPAIRDDWCVDSDANKVIPIADRSVNAGHGEQQSKNLFAGSLWQNDVRQMEVVFGYQGVRGDSLHCAT